MIPPIYEEGDIDTIIDTLYSKLEDMDISNPHYAELIMSIDRLEQIRRENATEYARIELENAEYDLKSRQFEHDQTIAETSKPRPWYVPSADALIGAFASVAGIAMILSYEQTHPIVSKALGFVSKIRI